jgi:hypothetical protein
MRELLFVVGIVVFGIWDASQNHSRILEAAGSAGWYLLRLVGLA